MSKLLVIDLSNYIYRAFYATTPLTAPDGTPVNAVYGVMGMIKNLIDKEKPTHVVVARDSFSADSARKEMYPDYKANRSTTPDKLAPQFALVNEMINALEMVQLRVDKYEADDVIGSVAVQWANDFDEVLIATGDKDILQFVANNVKVIDTLKGVTYDREKVKNKMGVYPENIVDYLALIGDKVDNIPGVEGIGPKSATKLLERFNDVESLLDRLDAVEPKRSRECLEKAVDALKLSKSLATIRADLPLGAVPEACEYKLHSTDELNAFFDRLNFKSWKGRF